MPDRTARTSVSPETLQHTRSEDSGIASLVVIAQLSGVAVSTERLKHLSGLSRPIDALTLVRLARQVALKARSTTSQISRIAPSKGDHQKGTDLFLASKEHQTGTDLFLEPRAAKINLSRMALT